MGHIRVTFNLRAGAAFKVTPPLCPAHLATDVATHKHVSHYRTQVLRGDLCEGIVSGKCSISYPPPKKKKKKEVEKY